MIQAWLVDNSTTGLWCCLGTQHTVGVPWTERESNDRGNPGARTLTLGGWHLNSLWVTPSTAVV